MKPASFRAWRNATTKCVASASEVLRRKPITGIAGCCARAARGHAAAAPPRSVMNARRLMEVLASGLAAARYHTVASERRCASQQKLRADVAARKRTRLGDL